MKRIVSAIDQLNSWVFHLIAVIFGLVALLTIYQVFARYVLSSPLIWSEAIVRYSMIWIVLLGTAIALRKGLLISVEAVLYLVPKKIKRVMEMVIVVINIIFLVLLIKFGFDIMGNLANQTTGSLDIPVTWIYAAIPAGSILAILNCIAVFYELLTKKEAGEQDGTTFIH
ncbi:inner membrane transport protein [Halalkalibacter wakoensis JCM 9140]|uniref:Inner membrane transport protein n=1 Tax=Halalkalibacter wakoensis JCM 9140 TaxID=1236970 RepID=W4Q1W9_9BACI|nr:TRAP transporter small permease [Halalkalibacter wakoensis]GAE25962.1 inner membrane transport protein [Halalkalibacter wakoensis JCM 9140]